MGPRARTSPWLMGPSAAVDRRTVLRGAALAVAGATSASLVGCAGSPPPGPTSPRSVPTASTTASPPQPSDWEALAAALSGTVVLPTDRGYATARLLSDPRFDAVSPAAVVFCASST